MLVVDPKERATLSEILNHPWMTKGFNSAPENFLPQREPLQLPLDPLVIEKMQGFPIGGGRVRLSWGRSQCECDPGLQFLVPKSLSFH